MTELHTLASGSSGNALLLSQGDTHILLDAGISCRRITSALGTLGVELPELAAIFITHTHTDHISGLQTLIKRCRAPIYASEATARGLSYRVAGVDDLLCPFSSGENVQLDGCTVTPFPTSHDAAGSTGYRVDTLDGAVGLLTDTGYVTDMAAEVLCGVDLLVLEANHDVETLRSGPYPYYLKQRILGSEGHLSNEDAGRFAAAMARSGTEEIVLAHLSRENNTPAMALHAVERALSAAGVCPALSVAPRDTLSQSYTVERSLVCRG